MPRTIIYCSIGDWFLYRTTVIRDKLLACVDEFKLERIVVYGSYARGQADYLSDIDIMLVIDSDSKFCDWVENELAHRFLDITNDDWPIIDIHLCTSQTYHSAPAGRDKRAHSAFIAEVKKEGVVLWKS